MALGAYTHTHAYTRILKVISRNQARARPACTWFHNSVTTTKYMNTSHGTCPQHVLMFLYHVVLVKLHHNQKPFIAYQHFDRQSDISKLRAILAEQRRTRKANDG